MNWKKILMFITLVAVISQSTILHGFEGKIKLRIAIVYGNADSEAASLLYEGLSNLNLGNFTLIPEEILPVSIRPLRFDIIYVVGGPLARGWPGMISRNILPKEAIENLTIPGYYGYWTIPLLDQVQIYVIIAGHTRNETIKAVENYLIEGLDETVLMVGVTCTIPVTPEMMGELEALGLNPLLLSMNKTVIGTASLSAMVRIAELPYVASIKPMTTVGIVLVEVSQPFP